MAQHDMVVDNAQGLAVRTDINGALAALVSVSSGAVEPATKFANMLWCDTSIAGGLIRRRNVSNTAWLPLVGGLGYVETLYTATTVWNKPANLRFLAIRCQGGGGAGGGTPVTTASQYCGGGGGGAGGYSERLMEASLLSSSHTVTVGTGGAGVSGADGGAGGSSSFGVHCVANGGAGGPVGVAIATGSTGSTSGGAGGVASAGTINVRGAAGMGGIAINGGVILGRGADTAFGGGGGPWRWATGSSDGAGANSYGSGGAGAIAQISQAIRPGGAGAPGFVYILEIF